VAFLSFCEQLSPSLRDHHHATIARQIKSQRIRHKDEFRLSANMACCKTRFADKRSNIIEKALFDAGDYLF